MAVAAMTVNRIRNAIVLCTEALPSFCASVSLPFLRLKRKDERPMKPLLLATLLAISFQAHASDDDERNQAQSQDQSLGQEQSASGGTGGTVSLSQNYDSRRVPPIFLYQTNQVESCGRVFGFSGANTSGGWAFGIPIPRSWTPTCDLWKAANEAQENGFIWLSYTFQCSIRTVRKTLGDDHCMAMENAAENEMRLAMGLPPLAHIPIPDLDGLYTQAAQYAAEDQLVGAVPTETYDPDTYYMLDQAGQLVAQVAVEEFDDAVERAADRLAQQDNLIQAQEEEIEQLREEAAAVKSTQDEYIEQEQTTQQFFQALLDAKFEAEMMEAEGETDE